jgi:hypothetical protein
MAQNTINRTTGRMARILHFVVPDRHYVLIDMIIEPAIALPALSLVVHILATAGSHLVLGILRHRQAGG